MNLKENDIRQNEMRMSRMLEFLIGWSSHDLTTYLDIVAIK
jgi:predicted transcriptional regulator